MKAREMQVEFERRITLMNPDFELKEKLTSDTIFSFLNAYTERFVRMNYLQEDSVVDGSRAQKKNADALKGLVVRSLHTLTDAEESNTDRTTTRTTLPDDYFLYIRSNSLLSKNYKLENEIVWTTEKVDKEGNKTTVEDISKLVVAPNKLIREDDVEKIVSSYYNKSIILTPYIVLHSEFENIYGKDEGGNPTTTIVGCESTVYANLIHDAYTKIEKLDLVYYRKPKKFDVIGVDNVNVLDHCELPENVHMEIVEGAVEMFITEAKYRLNTKQD